MEKDIVPQLTEALKRDFNDAIVDNKIIADKSKKLLAGKANFNDVYDVSHEVGNTLKNAFMNNIKKDTLPNGKMYYNIANRAVKPKLKEAHEIISSYGADVQGLINKKQGINIKGVKAEFNEEKTDNLVNKLCEYDDYDDAEWLLDENVRNYCNQSVDDTIKANADFLSESGFKETISRSTNGGCCEWCEEVSGVFDYEYVKQWVLQDPDHNVFSRHRYCNCIISHNTEKGRKAVNNQWNEEKHEKEKRKELSKNVVNNAEEIKKTQRILNYELLEKEVNGVKITNVSWHAADRGVSRGLKVSDIIDTIENPLKITEIKYDTQKRPSFNIIGERSTVCINPENGNVITTYKTHKKLIEELRGGKNESNS